MRHAQDQRGVTLIEAILALTILAIAMTALFRVAGENLGTLSQTEERWEAAAIAQSVMVLPIATGSEPRGGSGSVGNYRWERVVTRRDIALEGNTRPIEVVEVKATVSWGIRGQTYTLKRLVAVGEPSP